MSIFVFPGGFFNTAPCIQIYMCHTSTISKPPFYDNQLHEVA